MEKLSKAIEKVIALTTLGDKVTSAGTFLQVVEPTRKSSDVAREFFLQQVFPCMVSKVEEWLADMEKKANGIKKESASTSQE